MPDIASQTHNETHTETGHQEGVFPPFDSTTYPSQLLWLVLTFAVLYHVISKIALPRIGGVLEDRRNRIASDFTQAERLKQETDRVIASYEESLKQSQDQAHKMAEQTRARLMAESNVKRAQVEEALQIKLADAEQSISDIKNKAMADVGLIAMDVTETMLNHLTGDDFDKQSIEKTVLSPVKL